MNFLTAGFKITVVDGRKWTPASSWRI